MSKKNDSLFKKWHVAVFAPAGAALYLASPFASDEIKDRTTRPAQAAICDFTDGRVFSGSCETTEETLTLKNPS